MSLAQANAFAFSLATSLMVSIVIFRAGDGTLAVMTWRSSVKSTRTRDEAMPLARKVAVAALCSCPACRYFQQL
ncbi:MAG: hypothetical protein E5W21_01605 [Mesorhizobium sp.]|nr:MAG: hypothetical protein E5W21_01605 [Mesorhizobium sp.]